MFQDNKSFKDSQPVKVAFETAINQIFPIYYSVPKSIAAKLIEARELVKKGWVQFAFFSELDGQKAYCINGAIGKAFTDNPFDVLLDDFLENSNSDAEKARKIFAKVNNLNCSFDSRKFAVAVICSFNNEKTHQDVIAAFDKAIAYCQEHHL